MSVDLDDLQDAAEGRELSRSFSNLGCGIGLVYDLQVMSQAIIHSGQAANSSRTLRPISATTSM